MMNLVKQVSKKVSDPLSGAKVKRTAHVSFSVPNYSVNEKGEMIGLNMQDAIEVFGTPERLVAYAIFGVWNQIRTNEGNELAKSDKASKALKKAAKALKDVMEGISEADLKAMLLASPQFANAFTAQKFELNIEKTVDIGLYVAPVLVNGAVESEDEEDEDESDE